MTEKQRKPRKEKTAETYMPQLGKLPLVEKVQVVKHLKAQIDFELQKAQEAAASAKEIVNGL